jgi:transcriptional regulator with XRE-family HTH domain
MEKEEEKIEPEEKVAEGSDDVLDVRKIRESLGMSLDEISRVTRIGTSALEAIEKSDFNLLPEPVYARSFIEAYAKVVGIESGKILTRYNSYLEKEKSSKGPENLKKQSWLSSHMSIIIWCIVVFSVIFFFAFSYLYKDYEGTQETENGQAIEKPKGGPDRGEVPLTEDVERGTAPKIEIAAPEKAPGAEGTLPEGEVTKGEVASALPEGGQEVVRKEFSEETYLLEIKATEWTWLEIREDEGEPFEVLLKPDETIKREAKTEFSLIVGNAKGVDITFDGKSLGRLGRHGEVILLTLPRDAGN